MLDSAKRLLWPRCQDEPVGSGSEFIKHEVKIKLYIFIIWARNYTTTQKLGLNYVKMVHDGLSCQPNVLLENEPIEPPNSESQ